MTRPVDVFWDALFFSSIVADRRKYQRPGAIVEAMPEEKREMLRNLQSKDLNDRPDEVAKYVSVCVFDMNGEPVGP